MAIKEENYDPGYEAAYGGAYGDPGMAEGNGHCAFASGEAGQLLFLLPDDGSLTKSRLLE